MSLETTIPERTDHQFLSTIPGVRRFETYPLDNFHADMMETTHAVYPHNDVYGQYCTVEEYIDCPPEVVFEYMKETISLEEWTFSVRDFKPCHLPEVHEGVDKVGSGHTKIYCKTISNKDAMTVDYHCAWDQGEDLWMIYLNRIIPAELVLKKPGSVVLWTNCRHPYYLNNPYPEKAPANRLWVGDLWDWFYAGHAAEMQNLKAILEFRYKNKLPMGPNILGVRQ
ncbi:MAG: SRPBCC family protein [Oligoflexia bacterium]|nr:SRPBCC family protein [Oligoflexia bacterium]MBF0367180.1 SRPBCC family protein [Oligoflexia bacterium]